MLIDCARMLPVWQLATARRDARKSLERNAVTPPYGWGALDARWNARDEEYTPGSSKLVHFTTIHTQPWCPFPHRYVYQKNPVADLWLGYEQAADAARFELYGPRGPSGEWPPEASCVSAMSAKAIQHVAGQAADSSALSAAREGTRWLVVSVGEDKPPDQAAPFSALCRDRSSLADLISGSAQVSSGLVFTLLLDRVPPPDLPWVLEVLFGSGARLLALGISPKARRSQRIIETLCRIARRYPAVCWRLFSCRRDSVVPVRSGGAVRDPGQPRVWVLSDGKPGHDTQSVGLAQAIGWPFEVLRLKAGVVARMQYRLLGLVGRVGANLLGVAGAKNIVPPWPDLVITTGWAAGPVARWIVRQSGGATRTVMLGRRGGRIAEAFDIVIGARYHRLPFAPNRIETVAPLNRLSEDNLHVACHAAEHPLGKNGSPLLVALVGGASRRYPFTVPHARRFAQALLRLQQEQGGSLFVVTSRRTGDEATRALTEVIGDTGVVDVWRPNRLDNPYPGCLAHADVIVVTGDSESMLAEAAATGKPVLIHPPPQVPDSVWHRLVDRIDRRARARPRNRRGSIRPQQGLEYFCARVLQHGIVQPRRELLMLYDDLMARDIARFLTDGELPSVPAPLRETGQVAARVREMLQIWPCPTGDGSDLEASLVERADAA